MKIKFCSNLFRFVYKVPPMSSNPVPLSFLFPDQDTTDEERMDFLFALFPPNPNLNSDQYNSKMELWKNAIRNYCKAVNTSFIAFSSISAVKFDGKTSLALCACWESLVSSGKLLKKSAFKSKGSY